MTGAEYPHAPSPGHTDTSAAAAKALAATTARFQRMALLAIQAAGSRGLTAEELSDRVGYPRTTLQPRTSELRKLGLIRDSGGRRRNRSDHRAIVWIAVSHAGGAA